MRTGHRLFVLLALCGAIFAAGAASAQVYDLQEVQREVDALRADMADLQRYVYSGEGGGVSVEPLDTTGLSTQETASVQVRIMQMEERLRQLTGQLEELQYQQRQQGDRIERLIADVDARLASIEGGAGATAGGTAASTVTVPSDSTTTTTIIEDETVVTTGSATAGATLPPGSEMDQYNYAFSLLRQADYDAAEAAFQEFLTAHPDGQLAGNAYYWLGETYYVRDNYQQAAINFLKGYQQFPDSSKAPDNLLKLGITLSRLNKTAEACATFAELSRKFPSAPQNLRDKAAEEARAAGC
jgi:tol-pal system protein YbgF